MIGAGQRGAEGIAVALVLVAAATIGMARAATEPLPGGTLAARCGRALARAAPLYLAAAAAVIALRVGGGSPTLRLAAGLLAGGAGAMALAWPGALSAGVPLLAASGGAPGLEIAVPAIFTLGWGASRRGLGARIAAVALLLAGLAIAATASLPRTEAGASLPRETSPASAASNRMTRRPSARDRAIMGLAPWHRRSGNPASRRHRKEDALWCS